MAGDRQLGLVTRPVNGSSSVSVCGEKKKKKKKNFRNTLPPLISKSVCNIPALSFFLPTFFFFLRFASAEVSGGGVPQAQPLLAPLFSLQVCIERKLFCYPTFFFFREILVPGRGPNGSPFTTVPNLNFFFRVLVARGTWFGVLSYELLGHIVENGFDPTVVPRRYFAVWGRPVGPAGQ